MLRYTKTKMEEDKIVWITNETHQKIKIAAAKKKISMKELITELTENMR